MKENSELQLYPDPQSQTFTGMLIGVVDWAARKTIKEDKERGGKGEGKDTDMKLFDAANPRSFYGEAYLAVEKDDGFEVVKTKRGNRFKVFFHGARGVTFDPGHKAPRYHFFPSDVPEKGDLIRLAITSRKKKKPEDAGFEAVLWGTEASFQAAKALCGREKVHEACKVTGRTIVFAKTTEVKVAPLGTYAAANPPPKPEPVAIKEAAPPVVEATPEPKAPPEPPKPTILYRALDTKDNDNTVYEGTDVVALRKAVKKHTKPLHGTAVMSYESKKLDDPDADWTPCKKPAPPSVQ